MSKLNDLIDRLARVACPWQLSTCSDGGYTAMVGWFSSGPKSLPTPLAALEAALLRAAEGGLHVDVRSTQIGTVNDG